MSPRIGLALGGGAARGFAHIPMLEVLDELGIRPHRIAGTSMGALVGAAYAAGMGGLEIRAHALEVLGTRMQAARRVFSGGGAFDLLQFRGFGPALINGEALTRLMLPESVPDELEQLRIAFSVSAADFYLGQEVVLAAGSLRQAVAASIAIPGVIAGPRIDGRLLVDGGIINPLPVDHLRRDCDLTIAVDVTGKPTPNPDGRTPSNTELVVGAVQIFTRQLVSLRNGLNPPDVYVEPAVSQFRAHEFFKVREILEAGDRGRDEFKRALEMKLGQVERARAGFPLSRE
jgi:NTE family protein